MDKSVLILWDSLNSEVKWILPPVVSGGKHTTSKCRKRRTMHREPASILPVNHSARYTYRNAWTARRPWKTLAGWIKQHGQRKETLHVDRNGSDKDHLQMGMAVIREVTLTSLPSLPFSPADPLGPSGPGAPGGPWTDLSGWERRRDSQPIGLDTEDYILENTFK